MCSKEIELHAHNMLIILGAIVGTIGGGDIRPNIEHENLHFDNEEDVDTSSENYEESDCDLDLNLLTISQ